MVNLVEWKDADEVRSTTDAAEVDLFPVLKRLNIEYWSQLTSAPNYFPSIEELNISCNCHISLVEKIVSNITTVTSLKLRDDMVTDSHNDEHIKSLILLKQCDNNDVQCYLSLEHCGSFHDEILERLCHLPTLRYLQLVGFSNLTRLACEGSVESLTLVDSEVLRELPQDLYKFQSLRNLSIEKCPRFNKLGGEGHKSFVLTSLQELRISDCDGLTSLPGGMSFASLQFLELCDCLNLVSFPLDLRRTPSLEILDLSNCSKLMISNMPKGFPFLTSLRRLSICPFSINETAEFDWSGLISSSSSTLPSLGFCGLSHVESLPEQLQYLTTLTRLSLHGFEIEALPDWIGNLASLGDLVVSSCEKPLYLPSMAARRRLTKLTYLRVVGSPLLKEKCTQSSPGSEWPKIYHIPKLKID